MKRLENDNNKSLSLRIPPHMLKFLKQESIDKDKSINLIINELLTKYYDKHNASNK